MRYVRDVDRRKKNPMDVIPQTVPLSPHEPISAAQDDRLAAKRGRRTGRWLVLATVLVLVPMLMVLVGYVIGG